MHAPGSFATPDIYNVRLGDAHGLPIPRAVTCVVVNDIMKGTPTHDMPLTWLTVTVSMQKCFHIFRKVLIPRKVPGKQNFNLSKSHLSSKFLLAWSFVAIPLAPQKSVLRIFLGSIAC